MPNCGELLIFYLACFKAGVIATPLNYRYTPANIDYALGFSDAQMLFVHAERQADIAECEMAGKLPKGLVSVAGDFKGARSYDELMSGPMPPVHPPVVDIDATALIFFTSGSTGKPKGVMHSITSFGSIVASFAQAMKLDENDVCLPRRIDFACGKSVNGFCARCSRNRRSFSIVVRTRTLSSPSFGNKNRLWSWRFLQRLFLFYTAMKRPGKTSVQFAF